MNAYGNVYGIYRRIFIPLVVSAWINDVCTNVLLSRANPTNIDNMENFFTQMSLCVTRGKTKAHAKVNESKRNAKLLYEIYQIYSFLYISVCFWFCVCESKNEKKPDRKKSILLWAVIIVACRLIANSRIFLICVHLYHRNVCWFPKKIEIDYE